MLNTDNYLYHEIEETLEIHKSFEEKRFRIHNIMDGALNYIAETEKQYCKSFRTYRDWKKLLDELAKRADSIMYEAEYDITIAILLNAQEVYEAELLKKEKQ